MRYVAIRSEGGLIPYDLLDKIANEDVPGQKPSEFGLPKGRRLTDEISRVWSDAQSLWDIIRRRRESLSEKDPYGTTLTRDRWIVPLLSDAEMLGFDLKLQTSAVVVDNLTFNLSHRSGEGEDAIPVHVEGLKIDLDKRLHTKLRTSPQAMVQEFLNHSEVLWGLVTNGLTLRLLRNSSRTSRPTYIEFDLESVLEGNRFAEFALFYRLCHRSRFPRPGQEPSECLLEKYYQQSIDEGSRVREGLRGGVEETLKIFGNAFLQHPDNHVLREKLTSGLLNPVQYHRQLLLLVYRLLFLMVAEERKLIVSQGEGLERNQRIYDEWYSISRLRDRASQIIEESPFGDVWLGLLQTFSLFEYGIDSNPLGIPPLNGDLFNQDRAIPNLIQTQLYNHDLLRAVRHLSIFKADGLQQRVNYSALDVEELGSVYESLLDYQAVVEAGENGLNFDLRTGSERKSTGSYYTRPELVHELVESALVPVMQDRIAQAEKATEGKALHIERDAKIKAILSMSVCDPACGSGHFLLAAARRLGKELARIKTGEDEPTPEQFHLAVREVIQHCIYGVDLNPLAVDLCKLAMWLEGHWAGKPLSFLDHRIRCGNSLVGVLDPAVLDDGIPDDAFKAVAGDDKKIASYLKKRNKEERTSKQRGFSFESEDHGEEYAKANRQLSEITEDTAAAVRRKAELYSSWRAGMQHWHDELVADLWTAQFFVPLTQMGDPAVCTTKDFLEFSIDQNKKPQQVAAAQNFAAQNRFFHWHLEFPEVLGAGGFDVMLGNPPWVRQDRVEHIRRPLPMFEGMSSTSDLSVFFVELSVRLVRTAGAVGILTPNKWLKNKYGEGLRRILNKRVRVRLLIDFGHSRQLFPGADTFPLLCSFVKGRDDVTPTTTFRALTTSDELLKETPLSSQIAQRAINIPHSQLTTRCWSIEEPGEVLLFESLSKRGVPLKEYLQSPIRRGITTGLNSAFVVDESSRRELLQTCPDAETIIKPWVRGADVERWKCKPTGSHIIFTRQGIDISQYPAVEAHLLKFREQLTPRTDSDANVIGRKPGDYKWYEIQDTTAYFRDFEQPKILVPSLLYYCQFAYVPGVMYPTNSIQVIPSDQYRLVACLNSRTLWWFMNRYFVGMKDGALSVDVAGLNQLPIPRLTEVIGKALEEFGGKAAAEAACDSGCRRNLLTYEIVIDALVNLAFQLLPEEMITIRSSLPARDPLLVACRGLSASEIACSRAEAVNAIDAEGLSVECVCPISTLYSDKNPASTASNLTADEASAGT